MSVTLCGHQFKLPVFPSAMKDTISLDLYNELDADGYFCIMHRFGPHQLSDIVKVMNEEDFFCVNVSAGIKRTDYLELLECKSKGFRIDFLNIDVANGFHPKVRYMIQFIKKNFPNTNIIAGNVADYKGYNYLIDSGADIVRVGVGTGKICTTKFQTGFHLSIVDSLLDIPKNSSVNVPIIADGGCRYFGDIAKAIRLGATMVMSGSLFAGCSDSPARVFNGKKIYRGSTSLEVKGERKHVEGRMVELDSEGLTYYEKFEQIKQALQSSVSYSGGRDLSALKNVNFKIS